MDSHQLGPRKRMCYMHCDVNSFYASVEEARLYPNLENKPVAVRQRDLLVTTNHIARARGVPKMCSASEGLRLVPDLVIIESDMSRYRQAHRQLFDLLREMGLTPERASIDEAYLDLTPLLGQIENVAFWNAPDVVVFGNAPLDLENADDLFLARGVVVAGMIRRAIREKMRFETSAGVSLNKSFAKYASGLNKPAKTTVIPLSAHKLLLQLPPEKFNGFGPALMDSLRDMCAQRLDCFQLETLDQLQLLQLHELEVLGGTIGNWVYQICRGVDNREVKDKGPPGSFGFQAAHREKLSSLQQLYGVILSKAEQMAARLEEDEALYQRVCRGLSISFKFEGKNVTRAVPMPASGENRVLEICDAVMTVISKHYKKDRDVLQSRIFGISAHSFSGEGSGVAERSIAKFLVPNAEPRWDEAAEETAAPGPIRRKGALEKLVSRGGTSNTVIDWTYDVGGDGGEPKKKDESIIQGLLDAFVVRDQSIIDWNYDLEQVRDQEVEDAAAAVARPVSAAIDWNYNVSSGIKKEERKAASAEGPSVVDLLRTVQERNEQCPMCDVYVSKASLAAHVKGHFDDETRGEVPKREEKATKRRKKEKTKEKSIEKFFKKE